jgi:hypothetical protein
MLRPVTSFLRSDDDAHLRKTDRKRQQGFEIHRFDRSDMFVRVHIRNLGIPENKPWWRDLADLNDRNGPRQ